MWRELCERKGLGDCELRGGRRHERGRSGSGRRNQEHLDIHDVLRRLPGVEGCQLRKLLGQVGRRGPRDCHIKGVDGALFGTAGVDVGVVGHLCV